MMTGSARPRSRPRLYRKELFAAQQIPIRVSQHCLTEGFRAHNHDFMEIALIGGGRGVHHTVHGEQPLRVGDVFIIRPNAWHAFHECRNLLVSNFCFGLDLLERELRWVHDDPLLYYLLWSGPLAHERRGIVGLHLPAISRKVCQQQFAALARLQEEASPDTRAEQIGALLLVLGQLARDMGHEHRAASKRVPPMHHAVLHGIKLLQQNHAHPWALTELATCLAIDSSYLVRLFKAQTGLSPLAYLARHRAERAAMLLLQTDRPIAQIGQEVGWEDPNHFARRFKSFFGVSATTYRARFTPPRPPAAPVAVTWPASDQAVADD
jgi:AraC family transcriptional regulator, L-rhamnose operon transcriptional activator RhaR